ncbi:MAG: hypothetical protein PF689_02675 [Deltaproteobacteria bacterium]|jgi:hypothetical protein|nr:hypothetical protein [Deltaproteobacteria bacterium]
MKRFISFLFMLSLVTALVACDDDDSNNENNVNNINNNNAECGNGIIEGDEVCDATNLGENTSCSDLEGFTGGELACNNGCTDYDVSACTSTQTDGGIGDPCTETTQCLDDGAECWDEVETGLPGGSCMVTCSESSPCADETFTCVTFQDENSYCLPACNIGNSDCRDGMTCVPLEEGATVGICWAGCTDNAQCETTNKCDAEIGFCKTENEDCTNGEDDDMDGDIDCDDVDCDSHAECGCTEDSYDNHEGTAAYELDLTTLPVSITDGYICGPDFSDWFEVSPTDAMALSASIEFTHDDGDLDFTLYDSNFEAVDGSAGIDDIEEVIFTAEAGTTYYLEVVGYSGATNSYELTVDYAPGDLEAAIVTDPEIVAPGDLVDLTVILDNVGGSDLEGLTGTITSSDPDITIDASTVDFDTVAPGASTTNATPLVVTIASDHKNNQPIMVDLEVTDSASNTWSFQVEIPVPYGVVEPVGIEIINDDNSDGILDIDEMASLAFDAINTGDATVVGTITADVSVDASSSVTGNITITAPANTECGSALAPGQTGTCDDWDIQIPDTAQNGETVIFNIEFTDGTDTWTAQASYTIGLAYMTLINPDDPSGDDLGTYGCDLKNIEAYVEGGTTLRARMVFYSACDVGGLQDLYVMGDGTTVNTLTLENNSIAIWSSANGWASPLTNPGSFDVSPSSGSTSTVEFIIDVADIPGITISGNTLKLGAAVTDDLNNGYTDWAPDQISQTELTLAPLTW